MHLNKKIKMLREINNWSQEEMASKMNMSVSGYAKIERGESNINLHKIEKFSELFNINILELLSSQTPPQNCTNNQPPPPIPFQDSVHPKPQANYN